MPAPDVIPTLIETERLWIRAVDPQYASAVHNAIVESIDQLRPWLFWAQQVHTLTETRENMTEAAERYVRGEDLRLLFFGKADGELVGSGGLHNVDWDVPRFEIGYWLRTRYCGQGYATEAARAIGEFAFAEFAAQRVEIWVSSRNEASQRVAERAGFAREAALAQHRRDWPDEVADSVIFARTRDIVAT